MTTSVFNVTTYGAVGDGSTDNTSAFQSALDAAKAVTGGSAVYVPGTTSFYLLNDSVWMDGNNCRLYGDGIGSRIQVNNPPAFIVGNSRAPGGTNLPGTAVPRVDSGAGSPILDASVAGTHYGLRTTSNEGVSFPSSFWTMGRVDAGVIVGGGATSFAALTLDFIVQNNSSWNQGAAYPLFGCFYNVRNLGWVPASYAVYVTATTPRLHLQLMTNDGVARDFELASTLASNTAAHRFTIEVDFTNHAVTAYIDGVTVTVNGTLPAGLRLQEDADFALFKLGSVGSSAASFTDFYGTACDLTWAGFRLGQVLRFQNNAGSQQRIDLGTLNDNYQFFDTTSSTLVAFLPGLIGPGSPVNRLVWWNGPSGSANGYGQFLSTQHANNAYASNGLSIENLSITLGNASDAISLGQVLNFRVQNCFLNGGYHGIGSVPVAVSYPVHIEDVSFLSQKDCAIHAYQWSGEIKDGQVATWGRCVFRAGGCSLRISKVFVSTSATCTSAFRFPELGNNGINSVEGCLVDLESGTPSSCYVYAEGEAFTPGSRLAIRDCDFGTLGAQQPAFLLPVTPNDNANDYQQSYLRVDGLRMGQMAGRTFDKFLDTNGTALTSHAPDVRVNGGAWTSLAGTFQIVNTGGVQALQGNSDANGDAAILNCGFADGQVGVRVTPVFLNQNNAERPGLLVRASNSSNFWFLDWLADYGVLALLKYVNGVPFTLATARSSYNPPSYQANLQMVLKGPTLTAFFNGEQQLSVTDSFNQYACAHGIRLNKQGSPGAKGSWNIFTAYPDLFQTVSNRVLDFFNDANSTALTAHTPLSGGPWIANTGTFAIQGNALQGNSDADGDLATINGRFSDGQVSVLSTPTYASANNAERAGLVFRFSDTSNYWFLDWAADVNTLTLFKRSGGSNSSVATANPGGNASGTPALLLVVFKGSVIAVFFNGSQVINTTDSFNSSAIYHGLRLGKVGTPGGKCSWNAFQALQTGQQWAVSVTTPIQYAV